MISRFTLHLLILSFLSPIVLLAQFPTAAGTKWEYVQFHDDIFSPQTIMPSFQDSVVGDTNVSGNIYHIVRRTGFLYHGSGTLNEYDTLDGTYYYRVNGTQVKVLDSVASGTPYESRLYEFGVAMGDTLPGRTKNLINLTLESTSLFDHYAAYYDYDFVCPNFGFCDPNYVVDTAAAFQLYYPACSTFNSLRSIFFLPDVGTVYSLPLIYVLDVYGQHYFLKRLSTNGQILWENTEIVASQESALEAFGVEIYPNPAQDRLQLKTLEAIKSVKLVDAMGKTVLSKEFEGVSTQQMIDVGDLPRGLFWVVIKGESGIATRAVVLR